MTDIDLAGAHPRPQCRRPGWSSLDGPWDFAMETVAGWASPTQVEWTRTIQVPFAPETEASGIHDPGFHQTCWYRKTIPSPELKSDQRLLLHFNAVDYHARVWVNNRVLAQHEGGYTPFWLDITNAARRDKEITIIVRADDDPKDLAKPRGKQDWQLNPHSIWYPRTSGIWQSVWLEQVPETWIRTIRWTPNLAYWELGLELRISGSRCDNDLFVRMNLAAAGHVLARDVYSVTQGELTRRVGLSDPGIDDYRNELLWSPHSPTLIEGSLELIDSDEVVIDRIETYTALRSIAVQGQTITLNSRPYPLRMVLDQGYWPETGLTAPDTAALRRDVELVREMGFNGVRKHQKIEDERYLYWADRLGLLVWVEMPSAYRFTTESVERLTVQWMEVMERDYSHPSVIVWVPFNESWGVPNLPEIPAQRHFVQALYHLTKTIDPNRPVVGNDGWESGATDIIGIHDYDDQPARLGARYRLRESVPELFRHERPGGRLLTLDEHPHGGQPIMLTEFGGIAYCEDRDGKWGYSTVASARQLAERFTALLAVVRTLPPLAGFCYTQFSDTYQEANGLLYADRTPKFPIEEIAAATQGHRRARLFQEDQIARSDRGEPGTEHAAGAP